MRKAIIHGPLHGEVLIPSSKSVAHRMLICSSLSDKPTSIRCTGFGKDIVATIDCLKQLGAEISLDGDTIYLTPISVSTHRRNRSILNCGESGSTLRFMLPVAAALGISSEFRGEGRLPQRPLSPLYEQMIEHGANMSANGLLPLTCDGKLLGGKYKLDGGVSSQFVSGLLMALPLTGMNSEIIITGHRESTPYIDITIEVLKRFGIDIETTKEGYQIEGGQSFHSPENNNVEGDWSGAAFWIVAGCIGSEPIKCIGIDYRNSAQGDRHIIDVMKEMGATLHIESNSITAYPSKLNGINLDCSNIPDLVPAIAVAAAMSNGTTTLREIARLRLKESDRITTVCNMLTAFGIQCSMTEDSMTIVGGCTPHPAIIEPANDHRIAMASAVLASVADGDSIINDIACTDKSYPAFFSSYSDLGGYVKE